jgi:hypothetical protein
MTILLTKCVHFGRFAHVPATEGVVNMQAWDAPLAAV